MYSILIPALLGSALVMAALMGVPRDSDVMTRQADGQLMQYQTFMYTAKAFFDQNAPPASTTAYTWTSIKAVAPRSMASAGIPSYWKAVRKTDGTWVACTELNPRAAANLPGLYPVQTQLSGTTTLAIVPSPVPAGSITAVVGTGGASEPGVTPSYVVIGQVGATAAASANLCAGT